MLRELLEHREQSTLGPYAALAANSRGRVRPEPEHEYRTAFQRDRDRILHTKAFRRLKGKTQVFISPEGDHYRTRLTHTLEVAQIARTAARALQLNEDLVEAVALGHDLGHTPFGHAGEFVLAEVCDGFNHADQSLRIVEKLESGRNGPGLNLTFEVRDGIRCHSRGKAILSGAKGEGAATLEGDVVSVADAIAYVNHDIDDALRAGLIRLENLPQGALKRLGVSCSQRINSMVTGLIEGSCDGVIGMREDVRDAMWELRSYLYKYLYPCPEIDREIRKAKKLLRELYDYLILNPLDDLSHGNGEDSSERRTVDFIAGMTDDYALQLYSRLFFPAQRW